MILHHECYAYDVIDNIIKEDHGRSWNNDIKKVQTTKKHNIILFLQLKLPDQEYGTHFSGFKVAIGIEVACIIEGVKIVDTIIFGWNKRAESVKSFLVLARPFNTKSGDIVMIWNIRRVTHREIFIDFFLKLLIGIR